MKSLLLLPALALTIVGATLAVELRELLADPAGRSSACTGPGEPGLPVSSQGRPGQQIDLALQVHHRPPDASSCADGDAPEHWYVSLLAANGLAAAITPYPFPVYAHELLVDQLRKIGACFPKTAGNPDCSEAIVAIRARGDVPYHVIHRLIGGVACGCLYRLEFTVLGSSPGSSAQRLEVPLPFAVHMQAWSLRVIIRRNVVTGACERRFEGAEPDMSELRPEDLADLDDPNPPLLLPTGRPRREPAAAGELTFPCNAEGDARFRLFLAQWLADPGNEQYRPVGGLVEPTADVPLQAVVDLIDAFRRAGLEQISFSSKCRTR